MSASLNQKILAPSASLTQALKPQGSLTQQASLDRYRLDPDRLDSDLFADTNAGPTRKIALAVFLLVVGSVLLGVGLDQYFKGADGGIPMIVIGSVAFLPGAYYTRVAYYAWKGRAGFQMSDIPEA